MSHPWTVKIEAIESAVVFRCADKAPARMIWPQNVPDLSILRPEGRLVIRRHGLLAAAPIPWDRKGPRKCHEGLQRNIFVLKTARLLENGESPLHSARICAHPRAVQYLPEALIEVHKLIINTIYPTTPSYVSKDSTPNPHACHIYS